MKEDKFFGGIIAMWIFGALLNLAVLGFLGWAIYRLVMHFTGG